jgi:hypothetical protein
LDSRTPLRSFRFELASNASRGQSKSCLGERASNNDTQRWRTQRNQHNPITFTLQNDVHATATDGEARAFSLRAPFEQAAFDSRC